MEDNKKSKSEFKNLDEKKAFLDKLFYEIGDQQYDFELCYMNEKSNKKSKWRKYSTIGFDVENEENRKWVESANNRTILGNEIVLDLEDADKFNELIEKLNEDSLFYKAYKTGSRGYHIHLIYERNLNSDEKTEIIKKYGCDTQKASKRCMIALEFTPHWKTGNPKELIIDNNGINAFFSPFLKVRKQKRKIEEASEFFLRLKQAEKFIEIQPLFYNKAGLWWLWNFENYCYEMADEVDILNGVCKEITIDTTNSTTRTEILNALKQVGRRNIPKEAGKSWIQFKDTLVDVKTGEKFEATPKYFVTNPIPWKIGDSEETPTINKLFREWVVMEGVQDESYIDTLFEMIAYSGLSHQFLQRLFALTGVGSNGKGTYEKLIEKYLGGDNICTSDLKLLSDKQFESSGLYKKQACLIGEVDVYDMKNTKLLKQLSGEDKIRYEFKGKTPFSEKSGTTCFIATNSLPVTSDPSPGFYRRWLIADFPYIFSVGKDVVEEIPDKEFENLARKCIRICKELYEKKSFTNEGDITERMKRYEERSNPLMKFIETEAIEDPEEYTIFQDFWKRFNEYLKRNRLRLMTKRTVSSALKNEGFQVKGRRTNKIDGNETQTTCVFGIKLRDLLTDAYQNLLISKIKSHIENDFEKQSVSVSIDKQNDEKPWFSEKINGTTHLFFKKNLKIFIFKELNFEKDLDFEKSGIKEALEDE